MPRGRKLTAKSAKTTKKAKSAGKNTEPMVRPLVMSSECTDTFSLESAFTPDNNYDVKAIKTYDELIAALTSREPRITLGDNIIVKDNIVINYDLELDFNGFSIVAEETFASARVLDIRSGIVTLAGKGKVFAMGERSVAIRVFGAISSGVPEYTRLTVGKEISLYAPDAYGILISPNLGAAYGVIINFAGKIYAHDGICLSGGVRGRGQNLPTVNIESGASITAEETSGTAIEATGYGVWKVAAAALSGAVGAIIQTGTLNFTKTQVIASSEAFRIEEGAEKELLVKVEGGTYLSKTAAVISGTSWPLKKFTLKDCELYSPLEETFAPELEGALIIKNCEFETDVEGYLESLTADTVAEPMDAGVVETQPEKNPEPEVVEGVQPVAEIERLAEISDDDFVDEMFEFADELDENNLEVEIKQDKEADTDLKPAPTLDLLAEPLATAANSPAISLEPTPELSLPQETVAQPPAKKPRKPRSLPRVTPLRPFASKLHLIPELTDAETDEQEILRALNVESDEPEPLLDAKPPVPANITELEAARMALSDAIAEIRKLSAEDYDAGYSELEVAIQKAEKVLLKPLADLTMIRDAAAVLLTAFDQLEEHDEFALSDAELDELFYQGAVLQEMVQPQKNIKPTSKPDASSASALVQTEITKTASGAKAVQAVRTPNLPEPDFAVLSDALTTISTLDLSQYTELSQSALLAELDHAQNVLMNLQSTQAEIDEVAANLLGQMSKLKIQPRRHAASIARQEISSPAPVVSAILPATMVDELAPVGTWSIGVTMIDEMEPFMTDASTREKMLRALYPRLKVVALVLTRPFRKLGKSMAAGFRAGLRTYRETLRATR